MARLDDTIVLSSDSEAEVDSSIIELDQNDARPSRTAQGRAFPSLSIIDIEKRRAEVDALKAAYGEDDGGWGVKATSVKVDDQDIVSCVFISVMPVFNRKSSRSSNFALHIKTGPGKSVSENYRAFPPLRLKIELSVQKNEATFVVNAAWLLKDHTKRLKTELEKRFFKARSLLPVIKWLKEDGLQFLKLFKKNQLTYATPETDDWQSHYIAHRDPLTIHMLFERIADKVALLEGSELAKVGTFDCPICYDHKSSMAAVIFPQCKHHFCRGCVSQDLSLKINEGQLKDLKCLEHKCNNMVDMNMLKLWVDISTFNRYCDLTTDQFLDESKTVVRCPKKECNVPMELAPDAPREVRCPTCRHDFCSTCKGVPHAGSPCLTDDQKKQIREEWKAASEAGREALKKRVGTDNIKFALEDAESEEWISKNAKACPKCNTPIQKSDGCNKMVCTAKGCKTYFCWLCGKQLDSLKPYEHFLQAGNGACSGMLYTRIGPDGALQQVLQPYMAPDVNRMLQQARPAGQRAA